MTMTMTLALVVSNALLTILLAWTHQQKWKYANELDEICKATSKVVGSIILGETRITRESEEHFNRLDTCRHRAMILLGKYP